MYPLGTVPNRIAGALVGLGVGAAAAHSGGTGGGGTPRWGSGESRLAVALAHVYVGGYPRSEAAQCFLATVDGGYEVDPTSRSALERYRRSGDARRCGMAAIRPDSIDSALTGRCLPIGLVRMDGARRAAEVTAIIHPSAAASTAASPTASAWQRWSPGRRRRGRWRTLPATARKAPSPRARSTGDEEGGSSGDDAGE